jgi:hypothetical protein
MERVDGSGVAASGCRPDYAAALRQTCEWNRATMRS